MSDVAEAAQTLRAAEDQVRDDDLITVDLTGNTAFRRPRRPRLDDVVLRNGRTVSLHLRGPERLAVTGPTGRARPR